MTPILISNQGLQTSSKSNTTLKADNHHIALQSATGFAFNANNTTFTSGQNSSLKTGRSIRANAQSDIQFNTNKGGLSISAPSGATLINASGDVTISGSGRGDLTLHNGEGEIKIDAQGNIAIIATDVLTLKGMMTSLDAPVEYEITSPQTTTGANSPAMPAIATNANLTVNEAGQAELQPHIIELNYAYQDGDPVQNAPYTITLDDGTELTGKLDSNGQATLEDVPNGQYQVQFGEDTRDYQPTQQGEKNPLYGKISARQAVQLIGTDDNCILVDAQNMASAAGNWFWGTLQGDFNENPSTSQIVVGTIISMIPFVDQVMDVRDICANVMMLSDDDKTNDTTAWIAFTLTGIGLVPIVGSAIKGVGKIVVENAGDTLSEALAVMRKLGKGDPVKYLREINWAQLGKQAADEVKKIIKGLRDTLNDISTSRKYVLLPDAAIEGMQSAVKQLDEITPQISKNMQSASQEIGRRVNKALDKYQGEVPVQGVTNKSLRNKANELEAPNGNKLPWAKTSKAFTSTRKIDKPKVELGGGSTGNRVVSDRNAIDLSNITPKDIPSFKSGGFNDWFDARSSEKLATLYQTSGLKKRYLPARTAMLSLLLRDTAISCDCRLALQADRCRKFCVQLLNQDYTGLQWAVHLP